MKLFGTYPLPWDLRASFNYQHLPGVARRRRVISGAEIAAALGRQPAAGARATATVELLEPQRLRRESRLNQVNFALSRLFNVGGAGVQPGIELHNALNAGTIHTLVTRYGPVWEGGAGCAYPTTDQAGGPGGLLIVGLWSLVSVFSLSFSPRAGAKTKDRD